MSDGLEMKIGDVEAIASLQGLSTDLLHGSGILYAALTQIGEEAVSSIKTNFDVGGRPVAWKPLSAQTVHKKGSSKILVDTGMLMNSTKYSVDGMNVRIYNDTPYGWLHQYGYGNIPARPWFLLQPEDYIAFSNCMSAALLQYFSANPELPSPSTESGR
jgi:phage gpG-like protein